MHSRGKTVESDTRLQFSPRNRIWLRGLSVCWRLQHDSAGYYTWIPLLVLLAVAPQGSEAYLRWRRSFTHSALLLPFVGGRIVPARNP